VGLSHIAKEVLVLQAPGLIRNNRQLDHVRGALSERFERALYEQGFVLLGWGDVGKTYLMSSHPVRNPSDLVDAKPWVWESDPVFGSLYRQVNAQATPLPVPDVLQGLSNNVIETFYASPVAAVALQWHPHVRYINSKLITIGVGATVVSRDMWERATEEQRGIISEVTSKWHGVLKTKVRRMNSSALSTLRERGAEIVQGDSALWERLFTRVQNDLVGRIYSQELLNEVRTLVRQVR
jgi:TRAP-type C4-dicarboxylate transport system substrate-binding protein